MKSTPTGQLLDTPLSEIKEINVKFSNKSGPEKGGTKTMKLTVALI